ncbi:MAG: diguanylate cyclase [Candidatus Acidiferrales bacterium]
MNHDVNKNLDRARRSLEKNKLREAVTAFQEVLNEEPAHPEALQALADIYTRLNEPALAAEYYGYQFDRYAQTGDAAKATAIFARFLRSFPQPPARIMQYAMLLQRQNKPAEAIEHYTAAAELFRRQNSDIEALACCEGVALLDPENSARHASLAELAEGLGHADLAARSYLRAGQLTLASGSLAPALEYFSRAHKLLPEDRSVALLFAEARLRNGEAEDAVALLEPFWPAEKDAPFLALFGESLLLAGHLDRAREVIEEHYKQNPDTYERLFELAAAYLRAGEDQKAVSWIAEIKRWMRDSRRDAELSSEMDHLAAAFPASLPLAQTISATYEELNRETKYFEALMRLFDLYLVAGQMKEACESLERLVDIDPYDSRNQERIAALEGKVDPAFLRNILARAGKAATVVTRAGGFSGGAPDEGAGSALAPEEAQAQNALEDLIVQAEIFLQYSLQPKAVERLQRIAELFPGEEEKNERLRALCDRANWWPQGAPPSLAPPKPAPEKPPVSPPSSSVAAPTPAETHRDLAAIAGINRIMYRQVTPREVLAAMSAEIGKHLKVTRCLAALGAAGETSQFIAEYSAPGVPALGAQLIPSIIPLVSKATPDELGGVALEASGEPALREFGFESALGVILTDKETQAPWGAVLVGDSNARKWKPNESFFLQAAGDQLVLSVNHTRLQSLARSLAVADEKTGLVSRGAYLDCLLMESKRAREQAMPISLVILHIDHGSELLRQHGDAAVENYVEKLSRALSSATRQTDIAVKYTAWSLVFILSDASLDKATALAEKLREVAATVSPPWAAGHVTVSAVVAESTSRQEDDIEDRVTEWINRAEAGLDEVRQRGGDTLVPLATP